MTRLELTALMAATIAAGYRANPGDEDFNNGLNDSAQRIAKEAIRDAEAILRECEQRVTADEQRTGMQSPRPSTNGESL